MNVLEVIAEIEQIAPLAFMASWDKSGVQITAFREKIHHVAVMLDPTLGSIKNAIDIGADFLLAHHPLSMTPRYLDRRDPYFTIVSLLLNQDISLYSAHTSLDSNPNGPVRWLAKAFNLKNISIIDSSSLGNELFGFGFIGDLPESMSYNFFCDTFGKIIQKSYWQSCGSLPKSVTRIACCPGSGGSLLPLVEKAGADIYITGDIKYHNALEANVRTFDVGHFFLEEKMMQCFSKQLDQKLSIPVTFIPGCDPITLENYTVVN